MRQFWGLRASEHFQQTFAPREAASNPLFIRCADLDD